MTVSRELGPGSLLAYATSPILLAGLYVWALTCVPMITSSLSAGGEARTAPVGAIAVVLSALACLFAGVVLERTKNRFAPLFSVWGFLGLSAVAWATARSALDVSRLDSLRGALAALGFCLYSLAWGVPDPLHKGRPEDDPRAEATALAPRGTPSRVAMPLLALGIAGAAAVSAFAWGAHEATRDLVAHSAAVVVGVALVSASGRVAVGPGESGSTRARFRRAAQPLAFAALLVLLASAYWLLAH